MRRLLTAFVLTGLVAMLAPAVAEARSLVVGDGGAGCRDARYATIQAALDATRRDDQVVVCPGTYKESVRVHTDRVKLISRKRHAAVIQQPERGTVVDLYGRSTLFRGFTVTGIPPAQGCADSDSDAVVAWAGATVDYNRVIDLGCRSFRFGIDNAFAIEQGTFAADHNYVEGTIDSAVRIVGHPLATANSNVIKRSGAGVQFGFFLFGGAGRGLIQNNTIEDTRAGVFADGFEQESFQLRVSGNRLRRNGVGISVVDIGLGVGSDQPRTLRIAANTVLDSTGDGIHVVDVPGLIDRNRSLGSGRLDCVQRVGYATWKDNIGVTDSPSNLCRAP